MAYKVWNGSAWQTASNIKVFNGSTFVNATSAKIWNGSSWVQFYPDVVITNQTAYNYSRSGIGGSATARYQLLSSVGFVGVARVTLFNGNLQNIPGEWLPGGGNPSDYEVRGTWSGSGPGTVSGPVGWVSMGLNTEFNLTVIGNAGTRDLAVEIRIAATGTVIATATITFDVDSAP